MEFDISNLKVGIVTVTYNSENVIEGFMRSLLAQTHENFILYIIDNASSDKTVEIISNCYDDSRIIIVSNKNNLGVAEGNNQGIKFSLEKSCDYVLLINNDTEFEPELVNKLISIQLKNQKHEMIAPKVMFFDQPDTIWFAGGYVKKWMANRCFHLGQGERDNGQYDAISTIAYAPTCCLLIKNQVFQKVGLMDERYFVYYDDTDFCFRARANHVYILYYPHTFVYHKVGSLTSAEGQKTVEKGSTFTTRYVTRNLILYIRKNTNNLFLKYIWISLYFIFLNIKFLTKKDSFQVYKLKQNSFMEGLRIPLN
jgi:GT2 family glycosyltransferase